MRIGNPHMGWCSVERLQGWWHWASHKGGGRGQREVEKRGIQLGHVRRGRVWGRGGVALDKHGLVAVGGGAPYHVINSLFWTGGGGGQRHRQAGVRGH